MEAGTTVEAHAWAYTEIEVKETQEVFDAWDYLHVSFLAADAKEAAILTLRLPDYPECFGPVAPNTSLGLPSSLPMQNAMFTRMHELNWRRAEVNINIETPTQNIHISLTTDDYAQPRESDRVDLFYFQMLKWFKKVASDSIEMNQFAYAHIPMDREKTIPMLGQDEIVRENLTRESLRLPEEVFPQMDLEKMNEKLQAHNVGAEEEQEQNAKATLVVLRSLRSFTRHIGKLAKKVPVDSKSWLLDLVNNFNAADAKKNYLQPPESVLKILKISDHTTPLSPASMIQTLCRAVDKETGREERSTEKIKDNTISRADGPFALRVANKMRCEMCGRAQHDVTRNKDVKAFVRKLFLEISPPRYGSIIAVIRDSMRALTTFEDKCIDCELCNGGECVIPVGTFASNPKSIPKVLLLDVNNAHRNVFEEPEWLALDALKYVDHNTDVRRTNMSISKVDRILEKDPDREYSYKLHAVIRECNGTVGVEIYDGTTVTRVAVGKEWINTSEISNNKPPTESERKLAKLLVYVRTGLLEEADVDHDLDNDDDDGFETAVEDNKMAKLANIAKISIAQGRSSQRGRGRRGRRGASRRAADAAARRGGPAS